MNMMPPPGKIPAQDIEKVLGVGAASKGDRARRIVAWLLLLAGVAVAIYAFGLRGDAAAGPRFVTVPAALRDITVKVNATGTVQPTNQVEIASELSGIIRAVNVDYNDPVRKGQPLIELDTVSLKAQVASSRASVAAAKAQVVQAEATVVEKRAALTRTSELTGRNFASQASLDTAKAEFDRALAALESAKADVQVAEAQLAQNETSLSKTVIYSPIDGVVLTRAAEPGQTVAASFQTTTLLTLAQDLRRMELQVDIDEADIGKVRDGQTATFTVEAFQDRSFPAVINQVRFAPETTDGVVTYKAVLGFDNQAMLLRPGMTATTEILIEQIKDALTVPNAALRFKPPAVEEEGNRGIMSRIFFRFPTPPQPDAGEMRGNKRQIYVLRDGQAVAVPVTTGATDGAVTQIVEGGLPMNAPVITDLAGPGRNG